MAEVPDGIRLMKNVIILILAIFLTDIRRMKLYIVSTMIIVKLDVMIMDIAYMIFASVSSKLWSMSMK
jgi:hypothetical protein